MTTMLSTTVQVLVLGGLANLVLAFVLGWVLSARRLHAPLEPHRWLLVAHNTSLQEGMMLLGLGFAAAVAGLTGTASLVGAVLLVLASVFQDASGIVNWWHATGDQFAEKSTGWRLASLNAVLNTAGLAIIVVGVTRGVLA